MNYFGIRVWHVAASQEIFDRIKWCDKNNIKFFTQIIHGVTYGGKNYTEDDLNLEPIADGINISKLKRKEIGTAFFFGKPEDASLFKLKWV